MTAYSIVRATADHASQLAPFMRKEDRISLEMSTGEEHPTDALLVAMESSTEVWAALGDGQVLAVFGLIAPVALADTVQMWVVCHADIGQHTRVFLTTSRKIVKEIVSRYGNVRNACFAFDGVAHHWLRHVGFTVGPVQQVELHGRPCSVRVYEMTR